MLRFVLFLSEGVNCPVILASCRIGGTAWPNSPVAMGAFQGLSFPKQSSNPLPFGLCVLFWEGGTRVPFWGGSGSQMGYAYPLEWYAQGAPKGTQNFLTVSLMQFQRQYTWKYSNYSYNSNHCVHDYCQWVLDRQNIDHWQGWEPLIIGDDWLMQMAQDWCQGGTKYFGPMQALAALTL